MTTVLIFFSFVMAFAMGFALGIYLHLDKPIIPTAELDQYNPENTP